MDAAPEEWDLPPLPSPEEEDELRKVGQIARDIHRQANPSPVIGYALTDSIEDPFTGEVTVEFQLAGHEGPMQHRRIKLDKPFEGFVGPDSSED